MLTRFIRSIALLAFALMLLPSGQATAADDDGIVRIKSAYSMSETIKRLKKDVADKGIMFFDEIDQSKLAADAGVTLRPSTLIVFGNPPLGTPIRRRGSIGPCASWSTRMRRAMFGSTIRISCGSPTGTES